MALPALKPGLALKPHWVLGKPLGKGAFGEVFEGEAGRCLCCTAVLARCVGGVMWCSSHSALAFHNWTAHHKKDPSKSYAIKVTTLARKARRAKSKQSKEAILLFK